jgi:hypothetical protein
MKPGRWRLKLMDRGSWRLWMVALLAAPAAALLSWAGLNGLRSLALSPTSISGTIVATVLALAVAPALTWRTAIKGGRERAAGPIVASAVVAMALFGGMLLALALETSRALHQSA